MVIIKRKSDNVVTWAFDCSPEEVVIKNNLTESPDGVILDMTTATADKIIVETVPDDFIGSKYIYINNQFELNPDY